MKKYKKIISMMFFIAMILSAIATIVFPVLVFKVAVLRGIPTLVDFGVSVFMFDVSVIMLYLVIFLVAFVYDKIF